MANPDLDFYGLSTNEWIGMVLPYKSQKNQTDGDAGFGYRYRVAIMGPHPSDDSIKDEDIVFAIVALGVSDGTGAGNRQKSPAISQGDVVMGKFLDGDRRQNPVILNVLGRTEGIKYGKGRFEAKSGFVGSTHAAGLFDRQESSEAHGPCSPKATISPKTKNKPNVEGLLKSGLPDIPTLDAIPKPEALNSLGEKLSGVSDQLGDELSGALSDATGELSGALDDATGQLSGALDDATGQLSGVSDQLSGALSDATGQLSGVSDQLSGGLAGATSDLSSRLNENLSSGGGILGPISSNINEMVNVPTSTDSTPTDTVGGERTAPQLDRVTGDPGERTAPQLDRGGYNTYTEANPEPQLNRESGDPGERTAQQLDRGDDSITTQSITSQQNVSGSFDLQTGTAYINGRVVSFEEYNTFINLSNAEKVARYGQ